MENYSEFKKKLHKNRKFQWKKKNRNKLQNEHDMTTTNGNDILFLIYIKQFLIPHCYVILMNDEK